MAGVLIGGAVAAPAAAQTAYDINRLNAAIQVCNSGLGGRAECAKLRNQLGGGGALGGGAGLGGLGGGKAAAAAGIFGLLNQARAQAAPPPVQASAANPAAIQQAIATCVQNASGNNTAIQACLRIADAAKAPATFAVPPPVTVRAPPPQDAAMATYGAGQSYQACVAADQANWRRCLPLLNAGR